MREVFLGCCYFFIIKKHTVFSHLCTHKSVVENIDLWHLCGFYGSEFFNGEFSNTGLFYSTNNATGSVDHFYPLNTFNIWKNLNNFVISSFS